MRVLVVNAGSSSLKLRLLGDDDTVLGTEDLGPVDELAPGELDRAVDELAGPGFDAVGHRIVHGGERYREPVVLDADVRAELDALTELAPLHQPKSLAALDAVSAAAPGVPAVACFDTAFHATLPPAASTYAVPADWRDRLGVRRYGFHGLSHAYAARRAGESGHRRVVTCHLGAGASVAAVRDGRCVDTTMGFTPLEGLVMATRSGSVDPGMVLWLVTHRGLDPSAVAHALEHESGLVALAGTDDMAAVVEGAAAGDPAARLAFDVYVHRLRTGIAAMAASLGGLDALVFTGGVGENAPAVREEAAAGLGFLGVAPVGAVPVLVVEAREDLEIARGVRARLR
jgi:acetate kinase